MNEFSVKQLNLTMIIKTEFHFMIILLGLDRILVMENKVCCLWIIDVLSVKNLIIPLN